MSFEISEQTRKVFFDSASRVKIKPKDCGSFLKFAKDAIELGSLLAKGLMEDEPDSKHKIAERISKRSYEISLENIKAV